MQNINYKNGNVFESVVRERVNSNGYETSKKLEHTQYLKPDLKTNKGRSDISILKDGKPFIRIECKFINVHGSVVEKNYYPFVPLMKGHFPEPHVMLILGGRWNELFPNHINELREFSDTIFDMTGKRLIIVDFEKDDIDTSIKELMA